MNGSPDGVRRALRLFRLHAACAFSFAWVPVMYTAFVHDRGFTPEQYLELWSVYYLTMVVSELPWGWVADRVGTRPLLVLGPLVLGVVFLVLGRATTHATCLVCMAVTGSAHAMMSGADSAYLYELVSRAGRGSQALHEEAGAHRWRLFGVSLADLAGGLLAFALGTAAAFDLSAAFMGAAVVCALALPSIPPARRAPRAVGDLSILASLTRPAVLWVFAWYVLLFVLLRVGFQLYQPTLIETGTTDLRVHGGMLCLLNLVAGLAAITVTGVHRRLGERATAAVVLGLVALSFAGLSLLPAILVTTPLFALQQVSFGFLQPVGRTALNQRIASRDRAALLSVQSMGARLGFGGVLALVPGSALQGGLPSTYQVLAGTALAGALALWLVHPEARPGRSSEGAA